MSQYGWSVWASWAFYIFAILWVASGLVTGALANFFFGSLGLEKHWVTPATLTIVGVWQFLLFVHPYKKWRWIGIRAKCFSCLRSNLVFFAFAGIDIMSLALRPLGQSFYSNPRPICRHCGNDLREMLLVDDLK